MGSSINTNRRGVTLMEVILGLAILAITAALSVGLIKLLNQSSRQKVVLESQKAAQVFLYTAARDIRNAQKIAEVTPDQLVLNVYNFSSYGPHPPDNPAPTMNYDPAAPPPDWVQLNTGESHPLFQRNNIGTVTYQVQGSLGSMAVERISQFNGQESRQVFLKNILFSPIDADHYMFIATSGISPIKSVDVVARLQFSNMGGRVLLYRAHAMMRGGGLAMD